jgi:hypothetical protein
MAQAAAVSGNPLPQLAAQCRDQPVVLDGVHPDLCPALEQVILGRMRGDRGRRIGSINVGGWKSGEDFFAWSDAAVQALRRAIVEVVGASRPLVGWAMVNRAGSHHPRHQHRVAVLTGVYYVAVEVEPHPGRLAIFRGETWHRLPPYGGESPRITIAFDVRR